MYCFGNNPDLFCSQQATFIENNAGYTNLDTQELRLPKKFVNIR